jgi:hypothetical protein
MRFSWAGLNSVIYHASISKKIPTDSKEQKQKRKMPGQRLNSLLFLVVVLIFDI